MFKNDQSPRSFRCISFSYKLDEPIFLNSRNLFVKIEVKLQYRRVGVKVFKMGQSKIVRNWLSAKAYLRSGLTFRILCEFISLPWISELLEVRSTP